MTISTPLLIALLIGTQLGLSDALILPLLVAGHGEASFVLLYVFLKLFFILPVLQAEFVAGRLYRVTPFEFSFLLVNRNRARVTFLLLLIAIVFVAAMNLFNSAWTASFAADSLSGMLVGMRPLDQNLYWFERAQDINRMVSLVLIQGLLLMILGRLAWRAIGIIFLVVVSLIAVFILIALPSMVGLFGLLTWQAMSWSDVVVAMQHALTSSIAGFLIWYVLGTQTDNHVLTGRLIIGVQCFDVLFGLAALAISWPWLLEHQEVFRQLGGVLRVLIVELSAYDAVPWLVVAWLVTISTIGLVSTFPFLILIVNESDTALNRWLLPTLVLAIVLLSTLLVISNSTDSPLVWYGQSVYEVVQDISQGVIVPAITLVVAVWVGWVVWPNRLLAQINPHGGIRYFMWRTVLKFAVPCVLGLIFVGALADLLAVSIEQLGLLVLIVFLVTQLYRWVISRALFPRL